MSNVDAEPTEIVCESEPAPTRVQIITSREVPLGGPRAMPVRRTLPQRARSLVGAWCFADHYGPDDVAATGGMDVAPHPHTGLQTVSWLFAGEIEHRDSLGKHAFVRPGELNLMTGGHGIAHSEVSTPATTVLHGVQLWVALPDAHRDAPRDFRHHVPEPVRLAGATVAVFLGSLAGSTSPVPTFTPLLGAEITLDPGASVELTVDPAFEHGLLVDTGSIRLAGTVLSRSALGYVGTGVSTLPPDESHRRTRTCRAARRDAVRGGDRHVVELRRSQPRRDRRVPRRVAARGRTLRPGRGLHREGRAATRTGAAQRADPAAPQSPHRPLRGHPHQEH